MANYYNKDLYQVLELTYEATAKEIKDSFRKLARKYHPDVDSSPDAVKKFKDIKEAYDILINEDSRKKYDVLRGFYREKIQKDYETTQKRNKYREYINKAKEHSQQSEPFTKSINEALENLFHSKNETTKEKKESKQQIKGEDINVNVTVNCLEAVNGTNRKVNILHTQPCPNCAGRKFINGSQCQMCKGKGILSLQKKINVKIPKGVSQNSKVRVKGEGNQGLNGGKNGDLYLIINIEKNKYFEVDGSDILYTLPITPFEAVLGAEISIPVLDEKIKVKIPPMSSSGQKLKLTETGLYNNSKNKRGNIIITLQIKLPEKISEKEKELYKKLGDLSSSDIRKDLTDGK